MRPLQETFRDLSKRPPKFTSVVRKLLPITLRNQHAVLLGDIQIRLVAARNSSGNFRNSIRGRTLLRLVQVCCAVTRLFGKFGITHHRRVPSSVAEPLCTSEHHLNFGNRQRSEMANRPLFATWTPSHNSRKWEGVTSPRVRCDHVLRVSHVVCVLLALPVHDHTKKFLVLNEPVHVARREKIA